MVVPMAAAVRAAAVKGSAVEGKVMAAAAMAAAKEVVMVVAAEEVEAPLD